MARPSLLRAEALPCTLTLEGPAPASSRLGCTQVLRARPDRRLACRGEWAGRPVFVKLFAATPAGRRHWSRELAGLRALANSEVATPRLLFAGRTVEGGHPVAVSELVAPAETLAAAWARDADARGALACGFARAAARLHQAGLAHLDPHLDNFLVRDGKLLVVDGGDIRVTREALSPRASITNLALWLAQLSPYGTAQEQVLWREYTQARAWPEAAEPARALARARHRAQARRWRRYRAKLFRECTEVVHRQDRRHRLLARRDAWTGELRALLDEPETYLAAHAEGVLKAGNTSTLLLARADGRSLVVKRYNRKGLWHGARRAVRATRAARSWQNAHLLGLLGVPTARALGMVEERLGPLRGRAWLVMEHLPGPTLAGRLDGADRADPEVARLAEALAELLARLADARVAHRDLKASNLIVHGGALYLIDLDSMVRYSNRAAHVRALASDLRRLLRNWAAVPEILAPIRAALARRGLPLPGAEGAP